MAPLHLLAGCPAAHPPDSVAAIHLGGASAPRLLHTETRVATPTSGQPVPGVRGVRGALSSHVLLFLPTSQDLEDLEEAEEPDLEDDDDQKAVKDEL